MKYFEENCICKLDKVKTDDPCFLSGRRIKLPPAVFFPFVSSEKMSHLEQDAMLPSDPSCSLVAARDRRHSVLVVFAVRTVLLRLDDDVNGPLAAASFLLLGVGGKLAVVLTHLLLGRGSDRPEALGGRHLRFSH